MRKALSIVLCLALLLLISVPAFAAEQKTTQQRITDIQEIYGVAGIDTSDATSALGVNQVLANIEDAFALIGKSGVRKITSYQWPESPYGKEEFHFYIEDEVTMHTWEVGGYYVVSGKMNSNGVMLLGAKENAPSRISTVIHEFGHAWDYADSSFHTRSKGLVAINGAYSGYTNSNQYVSYYSATNEVEDFAELFMTMINNGGKSPTTVGKDTILYKKYEYVYNLMLEYFGTGSNAVKRAAAFLGKELPSS